MRIGVFDSGVGGLSILRKFYELLPDYDYVYFADNAHVPYGNKSPDLIYEYTKRAVSFLFEQNCSIVILACNSATATSLKRLQNEYLSQHFPQRRILGVILPVVEKAFEKKCQNIGVIGTRATVESQSFVKELHKLDPHIHIVQEACPLLVPIIEENEINWYGLDLILDKYLSPLIERGVEEIILACTHYELIVDKIQKKVGNRIQIISQGKITAEKLVDYINRHPEIESQLQKTRQRMYFYTDANPRFQEMAQFFLGSEFTKNDIFQLASK